MIEFLGAPASLLLGIQLQGLRVGTETDKCPLKCLDGSTHSSPNMEATQAAMDR